jgi:hypothetical protein
MTRSPHRATGFWVIAVLAAGVCYIVWLQGLVPDGSYFSGDSGLNAMLSQNLAAGNFGFNLQFPDQPWIKALWAEGFFPYSEPYVYHLSGNYYITFPYTFPLVSAPFFALLGYRGLYVMPVLATIVTWLVFYWVCRKMGLAPAVTAVGLAALIFTSNFSLYSAIYQEHSLSVCLSFAGLALLFPSKEAKRIGSWPAVWAGILTGLAVWFRPEQILAVVLVDFLSGWAFLKSRWSWFSRKMPCLGEMPDYIGRTGWVIPLASTLTLLMYGLSNWLIYRNFFGVHAIQVIEYQPVRERIAAAVSNFLSMTSGDYAFFMTLPIALFTLALLGLAWIRPVGYPERRSWTLWFGFCLLFIAGVAVLVPPGAGGKQWGPRFLLLLAPVIALLFAWQLDRLVKNQNPANRSFRRAGWMLAALLGLFGLFQNPWRGSDFLVTNYAQISPAVNQLRTGFAPVVVFSNQLVAQVLQPALPRDTIVFSVSNVSTLARLSDELVNANLNAFTYVCFTVDCKLFKLDEKSPQVAFKGTLYQLQAVDAGEYGKYQIYHFRVSRGP